MIKCLIWWYTAELFAESYMKNYGELEIGTDQLDMMLQLTQNNPAFMPNMSAPPRRCWVGNAASLCLCCRPTHSPSESPIRTTSSIRCGVGTWDSWLLNGLAWRMA